jgi:hypothetical protein
LFTWMFGCEKTGAEPVCFLMPMISTTSAIQHGSQPAPG